MVQIPEEEEIDERKTKPCIFSIPDLLHFRRSTKKHLTRVCLFERATRHDESRERERLTRIREMRWKYNLYLLLRDSAY